MPLSAWRDVCPNLAGRALTVLKAMVADTADAPGNPTAVTMLLLSPDAGFLLTSVAMAIKDIHSEDAFLPQFHQQAGEGIHLEKT